MADTSLDLSGNLDIKEPLLPEKPSFLPALPLSTPAAKEWVSKRRQNLRPWGVFFGSAHFRTPNSTMQLSQRLLRNVEYFQSNYLCVFLGLVIYCLITSPLLLIAIAASFGACYIIKLKRAETKFIVCGHELRLAQLYLLVAVVSIPVYLMAGAGTAIFWILGASFFFIMLHASFFGVETLPQENFDLTMETI